MKTIDKKLIAGLIAQAKASPRKRAHHNLHESLDDPVQRLCVALEPGTYIRPHRHSSRWEMFVVLQGRAAVLLFDDSGTVIERTGMVPNTGALVVEIQPDVLHTFVILEPETVMMEIKPGPYKKPTEDDVAPWAPAEGEEGVEVFEAWMQKAAVGDKVNR